MKPVIKCAEVLIEDGEIVLSNERTSELEWLDIPEELTGRLLGQTEEESILEICIDKWVYIINRQQNALHTLYTAFYVKKSLDAMHEPDEAHQQKRGRIVDIKRVPLNCLGEYGFSKPFCEAAVSGRFQ